jgi:preprotein translocase subunit SecY
LSVLSAFVNAFRTPDLRKKILFTIFIIGIYRLGANLPSPGVSYERVQECQSLLAAQEQGGLGVFTLLNLFSGGALLQLSVFALGIMPYITASIIMQLLRVVIPRLETLQKEGQSGQAKITQYTRYLTLGLAVLQSSAFVALAQSGQLFGGVECPGVIPDRIDTGIANWIVVGTLVITMTAGTGVIMWLGELITDRGVGNGMSTLIFVSIAAQLPTEGWRIRQSEGVAAFIALLGMAVLIITAVIFMELGQRRIPVQYAKRMIGRRMYGNTSTYIPLKINQAGVIPVIFASSMLYLPQLGLQFAQPPANEEPGPVYQWIERNIALPTSPIYIILYFLLIIFFTYFYVSITFNPSDVADNMKKYGGFVPGIRPGKPTAEYLDFVLSRITLAGSLYLAVIAVLPNFFFIYLDDQQFINFPFGGTAVLIMVGVGLESVKQIESQLMQRNYEGFLR